ncbi:MAG: hypothetical protein F6K53_33400 [Moorea sp. SIO4A1]|nr:hypothetical protein [Moorena sp. SIO4A1]
MKHHNYIAIIKSLLPINNSNNGCRGRIANTNIKLYSCSPSPHLPISLSPYLPISPSPHLPISPSPHTRRYRLFQLPFRGCCGVQQPFKGTRIDDQIQQSSKH